MHDDEARVGRILTRREALTLLASSGSAALLGAAFGRARAQTASITPACIARPQQTEGPFFVDTRLSRSDIRPDPTTGALKPGIPLRVTFKVSGLSASRCAALPGVQVDLWHCDASGIYSDVRDGSVSTLGQKFLRGHQLTDAAGTATFMTIYPGWYRGRTVHLHFKLRAAVAAGRAHEFTSQVYFDDALTDRVLMDPLYASRGRREVRNAEDGLFARGGEKLILPLSSDAAGYSGTFEVALISS